jgi:hypothetical protein
MNYLYFLFVLCFALTSCLLGSGKQGQSESVKDLIAIENQIENGQFEAIIPIKSVDTIIANFHIRFVVSNSGEIIKKSGIDSNGRSLSFEYEDRQVLLDITENDNVIVSRKKISKYDFSSIIPVEEIKEYQLWAFHIRKVQENGITFFVNVCIPDTDICYPIELFVSEDGLSMKEILEEDEMGR